jgi:hypothetical protein
MTEYLRTPEENFADSQQIVQGACDVDEFLQHGRLVADGLA